MPFSTAIGRSSLRTTDVTGVAVYTANLPVINVSMEIELITPVAMDKGLRSAIRKGGRTVGAGTVTEILSQRRLLRARVSRQLCRVKQPGKTREK